MKDYFFSLDAADTKLLKIRKPTHARFWIDCKGIHADFKIVVASNFRKTDWHSSKIAKKTRRNVKEFIKHISNDWLNQLETKKPFNKMFFLKYNVFGYFKLLI